MNSVVKPKLQNTLLEIPLIWMQIQVRVNAFEPVVANNISVAKGVFKVLLDSIFY